MKGVRWAIAAIAAVGVTATAAAAPPASNGRIVVLEDGNLFSVEPDGSDRRQITGDGRVISPVLSPNGQRIAFLKSDGSSPRDLYVMNADGTGGDRLIASHPETTNAGGIVGVGWAPDSGRLAYYLAFATPAIRIVDARDGTPIPLAQAGDSRPFSKLEWSPDGSELLYDGDGDIWVKPLDGRPARRVVVLDGVDTRATWSPDGTRITFINGGSQAGGGVYVVRSDGTDLRHVAPTGTALLGTLQWKPDATAVVFDATVTEGGNARSGYLTTTRILVAGAEGSVLSVLRDHVARPIPSPDSGQLLVGQAFKPIPPGYEALKPGVYAMNADGTCLTLVTSGSPVGWQPAPPAALNPPRACVDLVVTMTGPGVTGLRGVPYSIVVRNEGTLPARDVRFRLAVDSDVRFVIGRTTGAACLAGRSSISCRIDELDPGFHVTAQILARPPSPGRLGASVEASSASRDSDPASNDASLSTRVRECWISGTDFNDALRGTRRAEQICGHAGSDLIEALGGNDTVEGGWNADRLVGGAGRDRLVGGRGDDVILARDGERDVVDCGWGLDRVFADRIDRVLGGCEGVHRR